MRVTAQWAKSPKNHSGGVRLC